MSAAVIRYDRGMGRWEPDARGRLEQAAFALYGERGSNRPRWRRSPSGRGSPSERSSGTSPTSARSCSRAPARCKSSSSHRRQRARVRGADRCRRRGPRGRRRPPPGGRELRPGAPGDHRLERRASRARADQARVARRGARRALRRRGVEDPAASLTAEAGIAVFRIAFERWVNETDGKTCRDSSESRSRS